MRVRAFAPHPDAEIICAGTLAKYADHGHDVASVFVTNGEMGSQVMDRMQTAKIRKDEAFTSASVIKAHFYWMGFADEFLYTEENARLEILEVIRNFDPNIIICPDKDNDYHPEKYASPALNESPDHQALRAAALEAARRNPRMPTPGLPSSP